MTTEELIIQHGNVWTNRKNHNDYQVMAIATHTETREKMVCYIDIKTREWYVRPYGLFLQKFEWRHNV